MRIEDDIKLDFKDVLFRPKRSNISSRSQVSLIKEYKFKHSKYTYSGVPIVAANMDSVGSMNMAKTLANHQILTAIHKHYSVEQLVKFFGRDNSADLKNKLMDNTHHALHSFYSTGIVDRDLDKLDKVLAQIGYWNGEYGIKQVCIDVANGYTQNFVDFIKKFRDKYKDLIIMAGNVVTAEMTEELVLSGVDIVKVGIGPGCLASNTRILMANGFYKNIADIKAGDSIINMEGNPAKVKKLIYSGMRKVLKVRHNLFHNELLITPDHKIFAAIGHKEALKYRDSTDYSLDWTEIGLDIDKVLLAPSKIKFDLKKLLRLGPAKSIKPSFSLGFLMGLISSDNCIIEKYNNPKHKISWYLNKNDKKDILLLIKLKKHYKNVFNKDIFISEKNGLILVNFSNAGLFKMFKDFKQSNDLDLPEKLLLDEVQYLKGLNQSLKFGDRAIQNSKYFTNTSKKLIELKSILTYMLDGYFPSVDTVSVTKNIQYRITESLNLKAKTLGNKNYQPVKILKSEMVEIEVPTYDLEIDDFTHSFIANSIVVHNSVCTTRRMTGVGCPQLSAIIECADAAKGLKGRICGDGGITSPGDVSKAFGGGADYVMMGGMFAGHDEGDGELIEKNGKKFMKFYGMSSTEAMKKHSGGVADYRASEGKVVLVPYKGSVNNTITEILGGLRSTCTYVGAENLKQLPARTTFMRVTQQINEVFGGYKEREGN